MIELHLLGAILGHLGAILGLPGAISGHLRPTWPNFGHHDPSWAILGPLGAILEPSWGHLGAILGHLGAMSGPSWGHLRPFQGYERSVKTKHREETQMTSQVSKMCTAPRSEHIFLFFCAILGILESSWGHLGPS